MIERLACITEYAFNMQTQGLPNTLPWTQFLNPTERLNWTAADIPTGAGFLLIERVRKGHLIIKFKQRSSSNYQSDKSFFIHRRRENEEWGKRVGMFLFPKSFPVEGPFPRGPIVLVNLKAPLSQFRTWEKLGEGTLIQSSVQN